MIKSLHTCACIFRFTLIVYFCCCEKFQDLELGHKYENLTTQGNLISNLYRVVLNTTNSQPHAIRVSVTSEKASLRNPFTVTVIRGKTVHNIALSRVQSHQGNRFEYWFASDTLCDEDTSIEQLSQPVQLSIASSLPSVFSLKVKPVNNFHIGEKPFRSQASPPEPRYHMYTFPEDVEKVNVRITSESEICARLITRRANCPLFDGSGLLELSDVYFFQSFTKFGGFPLRKSDIGRQFHLALTVDPDDTVCGTPTSKSYFSDIIGNPSRIKGTMISVTPVRENTLLPVIPLLVYAVSMTIVLLLTFFKYKWLDCHENNEPNIFEGTDSEANVIVDKIWLFDKPTMIVSHKEYQKQRLVKDSKYFNFLFFQIFGSILPALTTLFQSRQQTSNQMDLDTCYLNYLCSSDVFHFNSFNAMTSASSLAVIGILNLIIVFRKEIFQYKIPRFPTTHGIQQRDAPKVVCLLGLVAMGILWTITNNCPHKTTLHLYIYTSSWLYYSAIMWIYSKRHGVRKWQQFYIIAVSSAFGCLTLAENMFEMSNISSIVIQVLFLVTSIMSTGFFCFKYYYERPSGLQRHQWITSPFRKPDRVLGDENGVHRPLKSKIALIMLAMTYSTVCVILVFVIPGEKVHEACFQLGKGQTAIYLFYYIIQKIRFERRSFSLSFKIGGILLTTSFVVMESVNRYLSNFLNTYDVLLTPAKSRTLNADCILPGIDWKDLSQYNCALNCFLFILLIDFIDSNIKGVPKKNIFVF